MKTDALLSCAFIIQYLATILIFCGILSFDIFADKTCGKNLNYNYVTDNETLLLLSVLSYIWFCSQLELKMDKKQLKVELFFFLRHFTGKNVLAMMRQR